MAIPDRPIAVAVLAAFVCGIPASTQTPAPAVPPLPVQEQLRTALPLAVTLRLSAARVAVGEVPTFTVVVRNTGGGGLLLSPAAVSNIRIFSPSGELVPAARGGIADYVGGFVKRSTFISLAPGQKREFVVRPEFHSPTDYSGFGTYLTDWSESTRRFALAAGEYSVRLTYVAFPDYAANVYGVDGLPNVWEGRVDAPPVTLTVLPPAEVEIAKAIEALDRSADPAAAIELLRLGRVTRAIDPLQRLFMRTGARELRLSIADALVAIDAGRGARTFIAALAALPVRERDELVTSRAFALSARATGCVAVPLILDAAHSGQDIVVWMSDALRPVSDACPALRTELIALLRTPVPVPATYMGSPEAYARRRAAEALGHIGNHEDVALLVAVLRREIPGLPIATNWYGDPAREGAARALGRLGGEVAGAALAEQLNDRTGNRHIMPVIIEELARINPPGAAEAIARLLDSPDQAVLVRVFITLRQLRAVSTVPQMIAALAHTDPTVRMYASATLLDLGPSVPPAVMLAHIDDPNPGVRANVMFYLARYGDASLLPRFLQGMTSDVQFVREASGEGIFRFGTAETFAPLRAALDTASAATAPYIERALPQLTFAPVWKRPQEPEWDAWWRSHAHLTRLQWAREALAPVRDRQDGMALVAVRYLAALPSPPPDLVEPALADRSWLIRDSATEAVQRSNRPRAAALWLRELDSRYLGACRNAVRRLNSLAGETRTYDCMLPSEREEARAHWATLAGTTMAR